MKKVILFFFLLLVLPLISSAQIDLIKESSSFDHGETLVAKISGNFLSDLTQDNVFFYRNVNIPVAFEYELTKINDEFYIYAMLERKSGSQNYTLSIENIEYMNGVDVSNEPIKKDFTITNKTASFSLKPGYVQPQSNFALQVQNLQSNTITIQIDPLEGINSQDQINVLSGEIKTIDFTLSDSNSNYEEILLSSEDTSYTVPVFLNSSTVSLNENKSTSSSSDSIDLDFSPDRITIKMATNSVERKIVYLINRGDSKIEDFDFFVSEELRPYVELEAAKDSIAVDSNTKVEITINSDVVSKIVEGEILVVSKNETSTLDIILDFQEDYVPSPEEESENEVTITTCAELEGNICSNNEECSDESTEARDGICCLSTCEVKEKSSTGKIIGWTMIAVVFLFVLWFFKRYKRVRPKVDLLNPGRR